MIVSKLIGGLGNQLFQYAAGRSLSIKLQTNLKLDVTGFEDYTLRPYCLSPFNITEDFCTEQEANALNRKRVLQRILNKFKVPHNKTLYLEPHFHFASSFYNIANNTYIEGFFQSEKYFSEIEDIIRKEFIVKTPPNEVNKSCLEKIQSSNAVSVHLRRGDYISNSITNAVHGSCTMDYYYKAIQVLQTKIAAPYYFIFSDDMQWVKENFFIIDAPVVYVDWNDAAKGYEDLRLMYNCKHNIIANSSFSWWGAWLNVNKEKIVIAPRKWFNTSDRNTKDLIPANWQTI